MSEITPEFANKLGAYLTRFGVRSLRSLAGEDPARVDYEFLQKLGGQLRLLASLQRRGRRDDIAALPALEAALDERYAAFRPHACPPPPKPTPCPEPPPDLTELVTELRSSLEAMRTNLEAGRHRDLVGRVCDCLKKLTGPGSDGPDLLRALEEVQEMKRLFQSAPYVGSHANPDIVDPAPPPPPEPEPPPPPPPPDPGPGPGPGPGPEPVGPYPILGNPSFTESSLPAPVRPWYARMWKGMENHHSEARSLALGGNSKDYARPLGEYLTALLLVMRVTKDLRILDWIDVYAQIMRSKLVDTWLDGTTDGYVGWLFLEQSKRGYGTDNDPLNEFMANSNMAAIAWAYHVNRNRTSPAGINYAERADFWFGYYFKTQFEPKWRSRRNIPANPSYITNNTNHCYMMMSRIHYYMHKYFGEAGYLTEYNRMAATIRTEHKEVSRPFGKFLIFEHTVRSEGRGEFGFQPWVYAKFHTTVAIEGHAEGMAPYDLNFVRALGNTYGQIVNDGDPNKTGRLHAIDCGGTVSLSDTRNSIRADDGTVMKVDTEWLKARGFNRWRNDQAVRWPMGLIAAFDVSNKARVLNERIYNLEQAGRLDDPRYPDIPIAMVLDIAIKGS